MATARNQMTLKEEGTTEPSGVLPDCSGLEDVMISRLEQRISFSDLKWPCWGKTLTLWGLL